MLASTMLMVSAASADPVPGYWLVGADGAIYPFGGAGTYGSTGKMKLNQTIVGMQSTTDGQGYWLVGSDGVIYPFGDAVGHGFTAGTKLNSPIVGMEIVGADATVPEPRYLSLMIFLLGLLICVSATRRGHRGSQEMPATAEAKSALRKGSEANRRRIWRVRDR
jgi:hypothetical protein